MKSMCKYWGLHISTNINCLSAVLGSFWEVWRGFLWCLKAKLRSWRFLRYWWFNKWYHGGYQLICLISRPLLIASRRDWYLSKGLLKGFKLVLRLWESSKNWWRYGQMKFVTEENFIMSLINSLFNINSSNIATKEDLESVVQQMANTFKSSWNNHAKLKHITKHSKEWWNQDCTTGLNRYWASGDLQHWKEFKAIMQSTKKIFSMTRYMKLCSQIKGPGI